LVLSVPEPGIKSPRRIGLRDRNYHNARAKRLVLSALPFPAKRML
jgi:hypothetical protein